MDDNINIWKVMDDNANYVDERSVGCSGNKRFVKTS